MRLSGRLVLVLLLASGTPLAAQQPVPNGMVIKGVLSFDGKATAGDFTGITHSVTGEMTGGLTLADVRGFVEAPVNTMTTGNGKRDSDMNKSMESAKYPTIRFDLKTVQVTSERGDTTDATLGGDFTIHGVTQAVELPATVIRHESSISVASTFPLNLKDYRIGGLSKFLGVLKMNEHIVVHVDVTFGFHTPAPAPS